MIDGLPADLSARFDRYLEDTFVAEPSALPGPPRRSAKLFVDSGAWIALFSARDQHHAEADALVREAIAQKVPLVTTNLVLAEVHRLLLFRAGARPAMAARHGGSRTASA